jgi:starch phosphorylase
VHVPTFLANEWATHFDLQFGGSWRNELLNPKFWVRINEIPSHSFWSIRQSLKAKMLESVRKRYTRQLRRNGISESQIRRLTQYLDPHRMDLLTVGFARRFATYKRATLLFSDLPRLSRLLNDPKQPVVVIFAGKAHPSDHPGQDLIRQIHAYSQRPEFEGKVILLEDYDMAVARKLVTGVDVWLNTPTYPMEASGTSGQKAGINGVLNLSVLDGWWDEGFNGTNGWAITPHGANFSAEFRDREEASELLDEIENEIVPLYYARDGHGYSEAWIEKSKNAMASLIPAFNAQRMVMDYVKGFYGPAAVQCRKLGENDYAGARELALWKAKVRQAWPGVRMSRVDQPTRSLLRDQNFEVQVKVELNGLEPDDLMLDCLIGREMTDGRFERHTCATFSIASRLSATEALFSLNMMLTNPGMQCYMIRMYPHHALLSQRFELGCMLWL